MLNIVHYQNSHTYGNFPIFFSENMSDSKQLRGGVVFLDKIPLTYSGKVDRKKLREMKKICVGE